FVNRTYACNVQSAVLTVGKIHAPRDVIEATRRAQSRPLQISRIDAPVTPIGGSDHPGGEPRLLVIALATLGADPGLDLFQFELTHHAPVGSVAPALGASLFKIEARRKREAIWPFEERICWSEIGTAIGHASVVPLEELLHRYRKGIGQMGLDRTLPHRQTHLFGLDARTGNGFYTIARCLRIRYGMRAEQQPLAPIVGVAADFEIHRHRTDVEIGPDEGIEDLTGRAVNVTIDFRAVMVVVIAGRIS